MNVSKPAPTVLLATLIFFCAAGTAKAQGTLNIAQKAQYLQAAVEAMQEKMAEGDTARVRMMVIGTATIAQPFFGSMNDPTYGPIIQGWAAAHDAAWPGQTQLGPTEVQNLLATIDANKTHLAQIGQECQTVPQMMPHGIMDYRRFIANAVIQREVTWDFLDGIASASPPPILLMQDQRLWQNLTIVRPYFQVFYNAIFGPAVATGIAQQRVIPEAIVAVEKILSAVEGMNTPHAIWSQLGTANENIDIVSHIEISLRNEDPPMAMPEVAAKVKQLRAAIKKQDERATEIKNREIDSNRMPENVWNGADQEAILGELKKAYTQQFPDESILRMVITSEETAERWESYWDDNAVVTVYVSYLTAAAAVRQPSGLFRVFECNYVRNRKADDSWSGWRYQGYIQGYRIREQNINK